MMWVVNATLQPLYPQRMVPIVQGESPVLVWKGAENVAHTGIRSPDRLASSESPYRLSYPGPQISTSLINPTFHNTIYKIRRLDSP